MCCRLDVEIQFTGASSSRRWLLIEQRYHLRNVD
jgi:hypothetical protein